MTLHFKAILVLGFCALVWGATFVVVKEALDSASVFVFLTIRFTLAAALMALVFARALRRLGRATLWAGAQIGFFMFAGYAFQTVGLKYTTATKAAFITGSGVVLVPLLLALVPRLGNAGLRPAFPLAASVPASSSSAAGLRAPGPLNAWAWAGALTAFAGLYFLAQPVSDAARPGGPAGQGTAAISESLAAGWNLGDLLVFVCAILFALHIIYVGRYTPHHSVGALSFLQVASTAVLGLLALPLSHFSGLEPVRLVWNTQLALALAITAAGATALAFSLQMWAQRYTSPAQTAILFSLEPVFAGITSYLVLGERLSRAGLLGAFLILAGIFLAEARGARPVLQNKPVEK
jgi:drug/metabolite transporter (DMT)-like permease